MNINLLRLSRETLVLSPSTTVHTCAVHEKNGNINVYLLVNVHRTLVAVFSTARQTDMVTTPSFLFRKMYVIFFSIYTLCAFEYIKDATCWALHAM